MTAADITLARTCEACPEQYDAVGPDGAVVGYLRVRFGEFTVRCPDVRGTVVYDVGIGSSGWDGMFRSERQRVVALARAKWIIAAWHSNRYVAAVGMRPRLDISPEGT